MSYAEFLASKAQYGADSGFSPTFLPSFLFDFQAALVDWSVRKGRAAIFADCGLGKTPMQLAWAQNVVERTNGNVLILDPLAVASQTVREAGKFGIECGRSRDGHASGKITITNYEQLEKFDATDFVGIVCDESSILKSFDGVRRVQITKFMKKLPYRLLCTATAAPNDYIELGTSSEVLGALGFMDMLNRFFRNDNNNSATRRMHGEAPKWRFKGHAKAPFWRWATSWARACRKPSDLGFDDGRFVLPPLTTTRRYVEAQKLADGMLFNLPAHDLASQREERKRTVRERCEMAASLVSAHNGAALMWCDLNQEGNMLEDMVSNCVQISGNDSDEAKEEKFEAFLSGQALRLVTKKKIGAWGLNFQHCAHITTFPSHSYEQYYQAVRRCWRFGQSRPVQVDVIMTKGDEMVMQNMERKSRAADNMFASLVAEMNDAVSVSRDRNFMQTMEVPTWL